MEPAGRGRGDLCGGAVGVAPGDGFGGFGTVEWVGGGGEGEGRWGGGLLS